MERTIYAVSTPPGRGGIGVVRLSGLLTKEILHRVFPGKTFPPRRMVYGRLTDGAGRLLDQAMGVFFPGPSSYTGEDLGEIHAHGNPALLDGIMEAIQKAFPESRPAQPGEFTKRAYLNGRMDLMSAEAVMEVISAQSQAALSASLRHLTGETGDAIRRIRDTVQTAVAGLEAAIDFPEEDWERPAVEAALGQLRAAYEEISSLRDSYATGRLIRDGIRCTMVGRPNAGKSSLLNAIAGFERAIVDETPGTTRDVLEYPFSHRGQLIRLLDTAGRREVESGAEATGLRLGETAAREADVVLLVLDGSRPIGEEDREAAALTRGRPTVVALNKTDLDFYLSIQDVEQLVEPGARIVPTSASEGTGIENLLDAVLEQAGWREDVGSAVITSARQRDCLSRSREALGRALSAQEMGAPFDLISMDAMDALIPLMELTGEDARAAVIDTIFAKFCVGK